MPQSHPPKSPEISGYNPKSILVGEDDLDDQEFLIEIFSSVDDSYQLIFAANGSKVLDYLEQCENGRLPCLILLDYNMPEMNGAEILRELKNAGRYSSIPKIIWSTSGSQTYKDICLELGAHGYVVKPSTINDFTGLVRHILSFAH